MNEERKAKMLLLVVVMIWGLNVVMVKYTTANFITPTMMSAWRIAVAAVLLIGVLWKTGGFVKLNAREWGSIIGIGFTGIFLHQVTLSMGLQYTQASIGSLILGLNPLVTLVLAYFLFREPLSGRKIIGVILGFCGVALVVFGNSWEHASKFGFGKGEWLIIIAMLVYVVSGMFIKKATETVPVLVVSAYSHAIAAVLLAITATGEQAASSEAFWLPSDWFVWVVLIFSGCVSTGLCSIWFNSGIRIIGAGRTAMFLNVMPIWGLIFSMIFLGETISWVHIVGFATVFLAIYLGTSRPKSSTNIPNPQHTSQA